MANPFSKFFARGRGQRRAAAAEAFFDTPLYLAPGDAYEQIRTAAAKMQGDPLQARAFWDLFFSTPKPQSTADGIAVVRVSGALYRGLFWDDYQDVRDQVAESLADGNVRAVLLEIDSPGGRVAGCFELTRYLFGLRGSGKPIWALANDQATSAAYAIGSAAERFLSVPGAIVGSIGAVVMHLDMSGADERYGYRITEVASGARKTDLSAHKPLNPEGRERLQRVVDSAAELFFAEVTAYRGLDVETLRGFEAGVFIGEEGLEAGLIDGIAMREDALDQLRAALSSAAPSSSASPPKEAQATTAAPPAEGETMAQTTTPDPAAAAAAAATTTTPPAPAAAAAARTPESKFQARARSITNICALANRPELAGEFISSGMTTGQVQARLLEERAAADAVEVNGRIADPARSSAADSKVIQPNAAAVYERWNSPSALMRPAASAARA